MATISNPHPSCSRRQLLQLPRPATVNGWAECLHEGPAVVDGEVIDNISVFVRFQYVEAFACSARDSSLGP